MRRTALGLTLLALGVALGCSASDDGGRGLGDPVPGNGGSSLGGSVGAFGGQGTGMGGTNGQGGVGSGGTLGSGAVGPASGGTATPGAGGAVAAGGEGPGAGGAPPGTAPASVRPIAANTTMGLDWEEVPGAESYAVYWSTSPGVTPLTGQRVLTSSPSPTFVHRGLTNGTPYYYVVAAIGGGAEGPPSAESSATPGGEWVLEELGSGLIEDVRSGSNVPRVTVEQRIHVLLFAEGYTAADMGQLHAVSDHESGRTGDVDRWVDLIFGIEPYTSYRPAFVVWYLPRESATHYDGGNTAFRVPTVSGPGVGQVENDGETAALTWTAIGTFPFVPTAFDGPSNGSARNMVTPFLMFDPGRGRAGMSGRATSLRNPANPEQRVASCFGVGHAHEFTHAFSSLRDEYLEDDNTAPSQWSNTSNVVGTSACGELPWQHLLPGGAINPAEDQLVGAFGRPQHGYHPELLCLLNGTHDNAAYYGGSGLLRVEDRMCNFCRETTALRVYQRASVVPSGTAGFDAWTTGLRSAFYSRFPFQVPSPVPQTNDVRDPGAGAPIYEACTAASLGEVLLPPSRSASSAGNTASGCVIDLD